MFLSSKGPGNTGGVSKGNKQEIKTEIRTWAKDFSISPWTEKLYHHIS